MKQHICIITVILSSLFCFDSCRTGMDTKGGLSFEKYYILHSLAGGSNTDLQELKANSATLTITPTEDDFAHIAVDYSFSDQHDIETHSFSLYFENITYTSDSEEIHFTVNGVTAICKVDNLDAQYADASLIGYIGQENSQLLIEGTVHGYTFVLDINSLSQSEDDFISEYTDLSVVDLIPLVQMDITNDCSSAVAITVQNDFGLCNTFEIAPGDVHSISTRVEEYPIGLSVEITYANGKKYTVSSHDLLSNNVFVRREVKSNWYPMRYPTGATVAFNFSQEAFSVKEP